MDSKAGKGVFLPPSPNWYGSSLADSSPGGALVAYAAHNLVVVVDVEQQLVCLILPGHSNRVTALSFAGISDDALGAKEGRKEGETLSAALLVSCAADRSVRLWEITVGSAPLGESCLNSRWRCAQAVRNASPAQISAVATVLPWRDHKEPSESGRTESATAWLGDAKGNVSRWLLDGFTKPERSFSLDSPVFSMAVTSGSSSTILAVGCADGGIHLRSARTGEAVSSLLNAHRGEVQSLSWLGCAKGRDEALVMEIAEPKKGDSEKMEGCEEGHDVGNRGRGAEEVVGWLASAGPDRRICVWSSGGELMRVVELPKPGTSEGAWSRLWVAARWASAYAREDNTALLLSCSFSGAILLWSMPIGAPGQRPVPVRLPKVHSRLVFSLVPLLNSQNFARHDCLSEDRSGKEGREDSEIKFVTCSMDRTMNLWRLPLPVAPLPKAPGVATGEELQAEPGIELEQGEPQRKREVEELQRSAEGASVLLGVQGLGGHAYKAAFAPVRGEGDACDFLAVGCGDCSLRLWPGIEGQQRLLWRGISSKVLCVAWHPLVTGVVAFGTEDGTVGCSDISHTPPAIASWGQRHAGPVAELSWHPSEGWGREERREEAEEVAETDRSEGPASSAGPLLRLFSVGADGSLLEWPALRLAALRAGQANGRLQGEPLAVAVGPAEALELPYTSGRISTFDWDASGEAVAVGCSDGSVAVLWRLRHAGWWRWAPSGAQVQRHSRGINAVRWAPGESSLLAAAGDDGAVSVLAWRSLGSGHSRANLPIIPWLCTHLPKAKAELHVIAALGNLKGPVYDVDWTSRPSGRGLLLAAACTDSVVRCWEVCEGGGEEELKQEASIRQLAVLKGHKGRVLTVCWSHRHRNCATDDWLLLSGGEDQTLRYWCPEALAAAEAEEEEQAGSQDVQQSALDSAIPPGEEQNEHFHAEMKSSGKTSDPQGAELLPSTLPTPGTRSCTPPSSSPASHHEHSQPSHAAAQSSGGKKPARQRKAPTLGSRQLLPPLNAGADDGRQSALRDECLRLASAPGNECFSWDTLQAPAAAVWRTPQEAAASLSAEGSVLQLLPGDEPSAASKVRAVQRSAAIMLWRGDVSGAMATLCAHEGALTGEWVGLAAAAGRDAWVAVSRVYAARQEAAGEAHSAALHLAAIGDLKEALQVYRRAGLLSEAIALGSARLLPEDPLLRELHALKAASLEGAGEWEAAACHHMAAARPSHAVAALSRRSGRLAQLSAVRVARRCLEHSESGVPGSVLSPSDLSALRDHLQKLPEGEGVAPGGIEAPSEATGRLEKPDEPPVGNPSPPCRSKRRYTRKELLSLRAAAPVALPEALPEVLVAPTKNSEAPEEYSIGSSSNPPVGPTLRYRKEELLRLRKSPNVPRGESLLPSVPPELRTKTVSLSAEEAVAPG